MSITPEERESILVEAEERILLKITETVGHQMAAQATHAKLNREFYEKYPEFADSKDVVAAIIEKIDGNHPFLEYEEKLKKAVPEIRQRIKTINSLDMKNISKKTPSRMFADPPQANGFNPHGEL